MRWVQQAVINPHRCAVIPFIGNSNSQKGFIDAGHDLPGWDPHVYVSVEAVEEMARLIGWQPAGSLQLKDTEIGRLERKVAELEEQVREADRFAEAAEYTLGRFGQHVRNKPGRKPKASQEA